MNSYYNLNTSLLWVVKTTISLDNCSSHILRLPPCIPAITALPGGFSPVAFCAMVAFTPEGPVPCRPAASGRRPFRAPVLPAAPPGRGRAAAILPKHNRGIAASR